MSDLIDIDIQRQWTEWRDPAGNLIDAYWLIMGRIPGTGIWVSIGVKRAS